MRDIEKLEEELNNVPDDYIVLIETTAEKAFEVSAPTNKPELAGLFHILRKN